MRATPRLLDLETSHTGSVTEVNFKNDDNDCFLLYNARTLAGSSGSPVFNQDYTSVLALHHHGTDADKHPTANRGVLTSRILQHLAASTAASSTGQAAAAAEFKLPAKPLERWSSQELAAWMASLGGAYREFAIKLHDMGFSGNDAVVYFQSEASWTTQLGVPAGPQVWPAILCALHVCLWLGVEIEREVCAAGAC